MSMEHKAYLFDYDTFKAELFEILVESLLKEDRVQIIEFIKINLGQIKEPN